MTNEDKPPMDTNGHTPLCEDYVSFETAKLLKEKGFDWEESPFYSEQDRDEWRQNNNYTIPNKFYNPDFPFDSKTITLIAPHVSLQMAMKWLREVHEIDIWVECFRRKHKGCIHSEQRGDEDLSWESSYEEACEAAINYCLENMI